MKRLFGTLGIGLALVCGLVILITGTPPVQAQTDPNTPTAPRLLYLPLIASPAGKSGIHLGNRSNDWQPTFLQHLQPPPSGATDGHWPAAVVIQSNQLYDIFRPDGVGPSSAPSTGPEPCWVNRAAVKQNNGQNYAVYEYLTRAIQNGTLVVIRISPSPGNFLDYARPGLVRHTLYTTTIAGGDYCGDPETQKHKAEKYRDVYDLAAEMNAIYQVNTAHGWPPDRFYFEPANEPNQEWYANVQPITRTLDPDVDNKQAWIEMDNYFAALYDQAIALQPNLQILAPSISQDLYGEHYEMGTCKPRTVVDGNGRSGIDFMKKVYGYDLGIKAYTTPKADGFAWHNYWRKGYEIWLSPYNEGDLSPPTVDEYCDAHLSNDPNNPYPYKPLTDHFFQYLSGGMQQSISTLPTFITEGDLKSPCQLGEEGAAVSKDADALSTSNSLLTFIKEETRAYANTGYGAQYIIAWLLVNQFDDEATTCKSLGADGKKHANANYEQNWHEAYREDGQLRQWFAQWWLATP